MKTKLIFVVQGYEKLLDNGTLTDIVTLDLVANSEDEALSKAKGLIKKANYRVTGVIEKNEKNI